MTLEFVEKITEKEGFLLLFKYKKSKIYHVGFIETLFLFLKYYRKPTLSFKKFKTLVVACSYPRKVRIISFKEDDYFNIFPMDLVGQIPGSKRFVFGLRHSNQSLGRIIDTHKIVVSEVSSAYKDIIYRLGKLHNTKPPALDMLSFKTFCSKNLEFPVPEWAEKYNEIKINTSINLGSHMLLWGESFHEEIINEPDTNLYHIHFLLYLHNKRMEINYTLA